MTSSRLTIIPPTHEYPGSLGDQGMIWACYQQALMSYESVAIIVKDKSHPLWDFLPEKIDRTTISDFVSDPSDAYIIGADVFDGAYSIESVIFFATVANLVTSKGFKCKFVSVSSRDNVDKSVIDVWNQIPKECQIAARDPYSFLRLRAFLPDHNIIFSTDTVFSLKDPDHFKELPSVKGIQKISNDGYKIYFLNANYHQKSSSDFIRNLSKKILDDENNFVYFVAHDLRDVAGDLQAARDLQATFYATNRAECLIPSSYFEIRAACRHADHLISARMHLVIAFLCAAKVPYFLEYNKKGRGLYELSNATSHCLDIDEDPVNYQSILSIQNQDISRELKRARHLSKRSFEHLHCQNTETELFKGWSACLYQKMSPNEQYSYLPEKNFKALVRMDVHRVEKALSLKATKSDFGISSQLKSRLIIQQSFADEQSTKKEISGAISAMDCFNKLGEKILKNNVGVTAQNRSFKLSEPLINTLISERRSVRNFTSHVVDDGLLGNYAKQAISLAPSVCNRQPNRIHFFKGSLIDRALISQNGSRGWRNQIPNLALITTDLRCFENYSERKQVFISGGLTAQSFITVLHLHGYDSCALNLDIDDKELLNIRTCTGIPSYEQPIMFIAFGQRANGCYVASSARNEEDCFTIHV